MYDAYRIERIPLMLDIVEGKKIYFTFPFCLMPYLYSKND